MKKRVLFLSLALVLVLMALTPAIAFAGDNRGHSQSAATDFTGSGLLFVTCFPEPEIKGNIHRYHEEIVEGFLDTCDWEPLAGTAFWSTHDSSVRVDEQGNLEGIMRGNFTLTRLDGSVLAGTFTGRIQGNLDPYTGFISDTGTWQSTSGTGVFEGVRAWGKWSTDLAPGLIPGTDIGSFVGPVTWEGKYIEHNKRCHGCSLF